MRVSVPVLLDVDPDLWAEHNNGPWPENDKNALNTAVRHSVRGVVEKHLKKIAIFDILKVEVTIK